MNQPNIAVICGGSSAEAEVSRVSARGVTAALRETFDNVWLLELGSGLAAELGELAIDVAFPIVHGSPGEDGTLQGFLEILAIPYVGSDVQASAFAMDKIVAKHIFRASDLPVVEDLVWRRQEPLGHAVANIGARLGDRVVVKPARQGSALGVKLVTHANELHEALTEAGRFDDRVLIEKWIDGKEITVGVLERAGALEPLPVVEVRTPKNSWYDYEHRYTEGLSEHLVPAPLPARQLADLERAAITAHEALGCRDLSRADFVVTDDGRCHLLEVNTLPGMTPTSLYPDAAQTAGLEFPDLVALLVGNALERAGSRSAK